MNFTQRFLKAKHWQVFIVTIGIPMLFQFITIGMMITSIVGVSDSTPGFFLNFIYIFPAIMILFTLSLFGWLWSVAIGLQNKLPVGVSMKTGIFKVFFFVPLLYILTISVGFGLMMNGLMTTLISGRNPDPATIAGVMAIIIPLHLFSMFCIFYCLYFVAKTIKTVELQKETTFSDFIGEFFLLWFYPIGIWILQPRINKLAEEKTDILY